MNNIYLNSQIQSWVAKGEIETNFISDGSHTFKELYDHRINLFIALCKQINNNPVYQTEEKMVWKSKLHDDGTGFEGWFIMGIGINEGEMITYHLPDSKWSDCQDIETLEKGLKWDGHTPDDVLERLLEL